MIKNLHSFVFLQSKVLWKSGITIYIACGNFLEFLPIESVLAFCIVRLFKNR